MKTNHQMKASVKLIEERPALKSQQKKQRTQVKSLALNIWLGCLLLCSLLPLLAQAQDEPEVAKFNNLYFGAEIGSVKGYDSFIQGGAWLQYDHHYFKIKNAIALDRVTDEQEQWRDKYRNGEDEAIETRQTTALSLIYGRSYIFLKRHMVQFGSGLSYVARTEPDEVFNSQKQDYEKEVYTKRHTIGIPAELRYSFQFGRSVAITVTAHGNLNGLKSYTGIAGGLAIGLF